MKSLILAICAMAATSALAGHCPDTVPATAASITQIYQGGSTPYDWMLSPTKPVDQPPMGKQSCNAVAYVSQYNRDGGCDMALGVQESAVSVNEVCTWSFADSAQRTRLATMAITCDEKATALTMDSTVQVTGGGNDPLAYAFTGRFAGVCGSGGGGGGGDSSACGGGCAFVIIFFVGGFVYVAATVGFNYFKLGKRGKELAPHPEFWLMIPGLIKDGAIFSFRLITTPCRKDAAGSTYTQV